MPRRTKEREDGTPPKPTNGTEPTVSIEDTDGDRRLENVKQGARVWGEDVFIQEGGNRAFSPMKELSMGSEHPEEYLMRTVFYSEEDQQDFLLEISQVFRMTRGYSDPGLVNWIDLQSRPSIKGARVDIIAKMFIGERERQKEMASGILRRQRAMNTGEDTMPQAGKGS